MKVYPFYVHLSGFFPFMLYYPQKKKILLRFKVHYCTSASSTQSPALLFHMGVLQCFVTSCFLSFLKFKINKKSFSQSNYFFVSAFIGKRIWDVFQQQVFKLKWHLAVLVAEWACFNLKRCGINLLSLHVCVCLCMGSWLSFWLANEVTTQLNGINNDLNSVCMYVDVALFFGTVQQHIKSINGLCL